MPVHAFVFPGQGSQSVGMGRDLAAAFAAAREVFQEVDETLKQKLSKLMFEGPGEQLTLTENTQPALMAMSLAVMLVLETEGRFTLPQKAVLIFYDGFFGCRGSLSEHMYTPTLRKSG